MKGFKSSSAQSAAANHSLIAFTSLKGGEVSALGKQRLWSAAGHAVQVTLGLPFIRTSPAHGTAFALPAAIARRPHIVISCSGGSMAPQQTLPIIDTALSAHNK